MRYKHTPEPQPQPQSPEDLSEIQGALPTWYAAFETRCLQTGDEQAIQQAIDGAVYNARELFDAIWQHNYGGELTRAQVRALNRALGRAHAEELVTGTGDSPIFTTTSGEEITNILRERLIVTRRPSDTLPALRNEEQARDFIDAARREIMNQRQGADPELNLDSPSIEAIDSRSRNVYLLSRAVELASELMPRPTKAKVRALPPPSTLRPRRTRAPEQEVLTQWFEELEATYLETDQTEEVRAALLDAPLNISTVEMYHLLTTRHREQHGMLLEEEYEREFPAYAEARSLLLAWIHIDRVRELAHTFNCNNPKELAIELDDFLKCGVDGQYEARLVSMRQFERFAIEARSMVETDRSALGIIKSRRAATAKDDDRRQEYVLQNAAEMAEIFVRRMRTTARRIGKAATQQRDTRRRKK